MRVCVIDFETSISKGPHGAQAKDPSNDFFTVIAGTSPENLCVEHRKEGFNREIPVWAVNRIEASDVLVLHNAPFDLSYLWKTKTLQDFLLRGGEVWDTQIAEYLMSGQRHSFASLGELQTIYLGQKEKETKISRLFQHGIGADKIVAAGAGKDGDFLYARCPRLFELYDKYCKSDGISTLKVFKEQYTRAVVLGMVDIIKLYNAYMLTLTCVQNTGIPVDLTKCEKTLNEFKLKALDYLTQATDMINHMWDSRLGLFNINSPKDKSAILFGGTYVIKKKVPDGNFKNGNQKFKSVDEEIYIKGFGLDHTKYTNESKISGRYGTGDEVVEKIYQNCPDETVKRYCELQKLAMTYNKMCNTYLKPFLELSADGLLYPNFNNTMTITSRLSSSKPNLQNIPSKGDMLLPIQGQLVAPKGWSCVACDYSQLEIYVSAYLTMDKKLTRDLLNGVDFHVKRLSYAEDMPYDDVYKLCKIEKVPAWELKRSHAKTISYQKAYGASPASLAKTTGIDESIIKKIFEKEDEEYPDVANFNKEVMRVIESNTELSEEKHIPANKKGNGKGSKKFIAGYELLPYYQGDDVHYYQGEYRNVGYYKSPTGKRYSFEEIGQIYKGQLKRGYSKTQAMNYQVQGTASDIQAVSSAALLRLLLLNPDKIKMVNEIHDSKWFIVKDEYLDKLLPIIKKCMQDIPTHFKKYLGIEFPFEIPVDVEVGLNFAETQPVVVNLEEVCYNNKN